MADKPSRALILYGDGQAPLVSASHSNLHSFASLSSCGFLSLRSPPSPDTSSDRAVRDLAQLLDAYDFYIATLDKKEPSIPKLSERFMGLRAAIFTSSPSVSTLALNLGFTAFQFEDTEIPNIVSKLLSLLGFSGGNVLEESQFDLVFLHVSSETVKKTQKFKSGIDWLDHLVGKITETVGPNSFISTRLLLSVILSYESVSERESGTHFSLVKNSNLERDSDLKLLCPRQSYTMRNGKPLDEIRHDYPMLIAQFQEGVTRRDLVNEFSFDEFIKNGGNLAILADRFLHEVAFKLWKAPKYGA